MKHLYLFVLLITAVLGGCSEGRYDCTPESITGHITEGKQIIVEYDTTYKRNNYFIKDGNNSVFEYKHAGAQCDNTADDELLKILAFEVDKNATQFRFEGNEITTSNGFYQQSGTWTSGNYEIKSGQIEGKKISESKWQVTVSVLASPIFPNREPIKIAFEQLFEK